jgi:hypothetical protein
MFTESSAATTYMSSCVSSGACRGATETFNSPRPRAKQKWTFR